MAVSLHREPVSLPRVAVSLHREPVSLPRVAVSLHRVALPRDKQKT